MTEVTDRDKQIFRFLHSLYIKTEGKTRSKQNCKGICAELDYNEWLAWNIGLFLFQKKLIQMFSDGTVFIAQPGVDAMEAALADPETPTEHFAAAKFLILPPEESKANRKRVWIGFVDKARETAGQIVLEEDVADEFSSTVDTLQAQVNARHPKQMIMDECVKTLRTILDSISKDQKAASSLMQEIPPFLP